MCLGMPLIAVANKVDLVTKGGNNGSISALEDMREEELNWWKLSCKTGEGFQELIDHVEVGWLVGGHFD